MRDTEGCEGEMKEGRKRWRQEKVRGFKSVVRAEDGVEKVRVYF